MSWRWFSVKTIYVARAKGKPRKRSPSYEPHSVMVEERLVLMKARSHEEAIRLAEAEAERYVGAIRTHTNPYGQEVVWSYAGLAQSFELAGRAVESGTEVFSATRVLPEGPNRRELSDLFLGSEDDRHSRLKFLNSEFSALPDSL